LLPQQVIALAVPIAQACRKPAEISVNDPLGGVR
jgi:hypothetical protein